ncbi:MAG: histidine triad nucleotide-binding protein [Gemmatimonadetes bacterium]|nr:histidine triad nucleotide-binding protein [Gemmatimonadota bacterium]
MPVPSGSAVSGCVFCAIAEGKIPARMVHEDEDFVAFRDLNPQAPTHVLIIPRRHIARMDELLPGDATLAGRLLVLAGEIARSLGLAQDGFRVVVNTGDDGGQTVHHLHLHVLGGRAFSWPPG